MPIYMLIPLRILLIHIAIQVVGAGVVIVDRIGGFYFDGVDKLIVLA
jgi:hypothetical protein